MFLVVTHSSYEQSPAPSKAAFLSIHFDKVYPWSKLNGKKRIASGRAERKSYETLTHGIRRNALESDLRGYSFLLLYIPNFFATKKRTPTPLYTPSLKKLFSMLGQLLFHPPTLIDTSNPCNPGHFRFSALLERYPKRLPSLHERRGELQDEYSQKDVQHYRLEVVEIGVAGACLQPQVAHGRQQQGRHERHHSHGDHEPHARGGAGVAEEETPCQHRVGQRGVRLEEAENGEQERRLRGRAARRRARCV